MDEVFKALADPTRRSILDALFERDGQTVQALCDRFIGNVAAVNIEARSKIWVGAQRLKTICGEHQPVGKGGVVECVT